MSYTTLTTLDEKAAVIAPNGDTHRLLHPGTDAPTLAECLQLAADEAARLNGVGVTYCLERWIPASVNYTKTPAHWEAAEAYHDAALALAKRDEYVADGLTTWRVVRQTREVLP